MSWLQCCLAHEDAPDKTWTTIFSKCGFNEETKRSLCNKQTKDYIKQSRLQNKAECTEQKQTQWKSTFPVPVCPLLDHRMSKKQWGIDSWAMAGLNKRTPRAGRPTGSRQGLHKVKVRSTCVLGDVTLEKKPECLKRKHMRYAKSPAININQTKFFSHSQKLSQRLLLQVKKRTVQTTKQHALVWFLFLITFSWQANLHQTHGTSDLLAIFIFDAWFQPEVGGRCVNVPISQSLQQRIFWCSLEGPSNRKHKQNKQYISWDPHTDDSWPHISTLQPFISKQLASIESPRWELQEGAGHVRGPVVVAVEGPRWKHDQIVQNSSGTLEMLSASYQFQSMNAWAGRTLYTVTSWHMSQLVCYSNCIPWLHRLYKCETHLSESTP